MPAETSIPETGNTPENTLILETSGQLASWAYYAGGEKQAGASLPQQQRRISQTLIPSLKSSGIALAKLDRILIGVGPGSFSGIRVAIASAQGLARAASAEVIPVRSTDALGHRFAQVTFLGIFTDARRNCFFFTAYENGVLTRASAVYPVQELDTMLSKCSMAVTTDGFEGVPQTETPDADHLYRAFLKNNTEDGLKLEPVYLHPAVSL
jgi:tRNA threonylcarbamoyl adenosine modification protein YeaZ